MIQTTVEGFFLSVSQEFPFNSLYFFNFLSYALDGLYE